jgi:hypothetical protein
VQVMVHGRFMNPAISVTMRIADSTAAFASWQAIIAVSPRSRQLSDLRNRKAMSGKPARAPVGARAYSVVRSHGTDLSSWHSATLPRKFAAAMRPKADVDS